MASILMLEVAQLEGVLQVWPQALVPVLVQV